MTASMKNMEAAIFNRRDNHFCTICVGRFIDKSCWRFLTIQKCYMFGIISNQFSQHFILIHFTARSMATHTHPNRGPSAKIAGLLVLVSFLPFWNINSIILGPIARVCSLTEFSLCLRERTNRIRWSPSFWCGTSLIGSYTFL